jgi:hypothetical protein
MQTSCLIALLRSFGNTTGIDVAVKFRDPVGDVVPSVRLTELEVDIFSELILIMAYTVVALTLRYGYLASLAAIHCIIHIVLS